jgi:hypothetical protein
MASGVCPSHNALKGTKNKTLFLKLDLLPSSQEMLGGFCSVGFLRMAFSRHFGVHRVEVHSIIFMNKEVHKLQTLGI